MNHREDVWLDGVEDYISHAKNLLIEAADSDSPVSGLKEGLSQARTSGQHASSDRAALDGSQTKGSKLPVTGKSPSRSSVHYEHGYAECTHHRPDAIERCTSRSCTL